MLLFLSALQAAPSFNRFFVIVLENTDYDVAISLPYFKDLANMGRLYTNSHGTSHNSQPNYLAMIAGQDFGLYTPEQIDDSDHDKSYPGVKTVVDLLEAKNITWGTYQENYPLPQGCSMINNVNGEYERKHNPFISFPLITENSNRCQNIKASSELLGDIDNKRVPRYVMYVPNQTNDGHGAPPYPKPTAENTLARIKMADKYLSEFLPPLLRNPYFNDTLFLITFDENDVVFKNKPFSDVGKENKIYTVAVGAGVKAGSVDNDYYNHYSQIALLQSEWGLDSLEQNDKTAKPFALRENVNTSSTTTSPVAFVTKSATRVETKTAYPEATPTFTNLPTLANSEMQRFAFLAAITILLC